MSDTQTKQPAAGVADLDSGTWYRAGCSGLWYRNPMAAGSFDAIKIDGRMLMVVGGCVELVDARTARKTAFASSAWVGDWDEARNREYARKLRAGEPTTEEEWDASYNWHREQLRRQSGESPTQ